MSPGAAASASAFGIASVEHCVFCFDSLVAHLNGAAAPQPEFEDGTW